MLCPASRLLQRDVAPGHARGSALLAVLWVIAFLSFLVVTSMMVAMQGVETASSRQLVVRARQVAELGLAVGAHPLVKAGDPVLRRKISPTESCEVSMSTEEARLNINAMLSEERRAVLERLFETWGLSPPDAQGVVDCLMDWVDEDDFKRLTGAEKGDYRKEGFTGRPYNRPFRNLDEVALVRGMDKVAEANPKWRDAFTLWGGGALDINEARADLIAAVADVSLGAAARLVRTRDGPDGVPHTEDDAPLESMEEAFALLGSPAQAAGGTASLFTLHGSIRRVESIGRSGGYARRISVVLRPGVVGGILDWRESAVE